MAPEFKDKVRYANPIRIIEYVIAVATIVGGLYLLSPLFVAPLAPGASPMLSLLIARPGVIAVSAAAVLSGGLHLWGLIRNNFKFRSVGLFTNAMVRMYAIIVQWLVLGQIVFPWESNFVLLILVLVLWFTHRLRTERVR